MASSTNSEMSASAPTYSTEARQHAAATEWMELEVCAPNMLSRVDHRTRSELSKQFNCDLEAPISVGGGLKRSASALLNISPGFGLGQCTY